MSTRLQQESRGTYLTSVAPKGVWLLPAFGLLLALSTIRQQPPVQADFEGYARFVTTGEFLFSHLVASIGGAALAILGSCSVFALLAGGRFRRAALIGTIITVIAQVYLASAFGSAAFVQPGIGRRAYLPTHQGLRREQQRRVRSRLRRHPDDVSQMKQQDLHGTNANAGRVEHGEAHTVPLTY